MKWNYACIFIHNIYLNQFLDETKRIDLITQTNNQCALEYFVGNMFWSKPIFQQRVWKYKNPVIPEVQFGIGIEKVPSNASFPPHCYTAVSPCCKYFSAAENCYQCLTPSSTVVSQILTKNLSQCVKNILIKVQMSTSYSLVTSYRNTGRQMYIYSKWFLWIFATSKFQVNFKLGAGSNMEYSECKGTALRQKQQR